MPLGDVLPPITIVYTQPGCGPCVSVKAKLRKLDVPFEEIDVTQGDNAERVRALGYQGTPVTVRPDGTSHHGYRPGLLAQIKEG